MKNMLKSFNDIILISFLSIVEALQVLVIVSHIYSFIPIHWKVPIPKGLEPERESFLYIIFLSVACILMASGFMLMRRLNMEEHRKQLKMFLMMESAWLFLQLFAFFKWLTYRYPFYNIFPYENGQWVMPFFYGVVFLSLLSKIFWPEIYKWFQAGYPRWGQLKLSQGQQELICVGIAAGIVILLWPRFEDVLALNYVWDQFNHWDQYPPIKGLMYLGLNYQQILVILVTVTIVGWIAVFYLIRRWLNSMLLAAMAVVIGIKISLFHYGQVPVAWVYPQAILPSIDLNHLLLNGFDNVPMFDALRVRQFFSFFMGYGIVIFYVFSVVLLLRPWRDLDRGQRIALILSVFGLLIYTDYIIHPKLFSYGVGALPAVGVFCFWLSFIHRRVVYAVFLGLSIFFLITNRLFVIYPHAVAIFGQDFSKEKAIYAQDFNLSSDVQLVNQLIREDQPAAIIGSFEMALLNQSKHPSYWRQGPIYLSAPFYSNEIKGLRLRTKEELLRILQQLSDYPPPYIFIEKKLLELPVDFYQGNLGLAHLLRQVQNDYHLIAQSNHYTAWQRK